MEGGVQNSWSIYGQNGGRHSAFSDEKWIFSSAVCKVGSSVCWRDMPRYLLIAVCRSYPDSDEFFNYQSIVCPEGEYARLAFALRETLPLTCSVRVALISVHVRGIHFLASKDPQCVLVSHLFRTAVRTQPCSLSTNTQIIQQMHRWPLRVHW